jgi:hypothetical protein
VLTDLLHSEVGEAKLELLVHHISEDDPTIHRTRGFLHASKKSRRVDRGELGRVCLWKLGRNLGLE